jgi:hypothetical protein
MHFVQGDQVKRRTKEERELGTFFCKAQEIGSLVEKKNAAYGDSVAVSPKILALLYPNGVFVEDYRKMLLTVRILDKLQRIAHDQNAFNEDPWADIAGYGVLGAVMSEEK